MSYPDCDCKICRDLPPDQYRTFEELNVGDNFIWAPTPGDNSGHGGLRGSVYVFVKTGFNTADKLSTGVESMMTPNMDIVQVVL